MGIGLGCLAMSPAAFWALSIPEFTAAVRGRFGERSFDVSLNRSRLDALMKQFPDREQC
ncbi:MAG: phage tail assembly chaperone [Pseudomonadota bacterium]